MQSPPPHHQHRHRHHERNQPLIQLDKPASHPPPNNLSEWNVFVNINTKWMRGDSEEDSYIHKHTHTQARQWIRVFLENNWRNSFIINTTTLERERITYYEKYNRNQRGTNMWINLFINEFNLTVGIDGNLFNVTHNDVNAIYLLL